MLKRSIFGIMFALALLWSHPLQAQDQAARLYEQARSLVERAQRADTPRAALPLLRQAKVKLDTIIHQHASSEIATRLILGDRLERALATALELAEREDSALHAACLSTPTPSCLIDVARSTVDHIASDDVDTLLWIASAAFKVNSPDVFQSLFGQVATLTHSDRIGDEYRRAEAQRAMAATLADVGRFGAAFDQAQRIKLLYARDGALRIILTRALDEGNLGFATWVADQIQDKERAQALPALALIEAERGRIESALSMVSRIEDAAERARGMSGLAKLQAETGHEDQARSTFEAARAVAQTMDFGRDWTLVSIATDQRNAGLISESLVTIENITEPLARTQAAAMTAVSFHSLDNREESLSWLGSASAAAESVADAPSRDWAHLFVAQAHAQMGLAQVAIDTVNEISNPTIEARAYAALAMGLAGQLEPTAVAGRRSSAELDRTLDELVGCPRPYRVECVVDRAHLAGPSADLALAYAHLGDLNAALAITEALDDAGAQLNVLIEIAGKSSIEYSPIMAEKIGDLGRSISEENNLWQTPSAAIVYHRAGRHQSALDLLRHYASVDKWWASPARIADTYAETGERELGRKHFLKAVGEGYDACGDPDGYRVQARIGDLAGAVQSAIQCEDLRGYALEKIAIGLAQSRRFEQALSLLERHDIQLPLPNYAGDPLGVDFAVLQATNNFEQTRKDMQGFIHRLYRASHPCYRLVEWRVMIHSSVELDLFEMALSISSMLRELTSDAYSDPDCHESFADGALIAAAATLARGAINDEQRRVAWETALRAREINSDLRQQVERAFLGALALALASQPTAAAEASAVFPLLSQKSPTNYGDPAFRDLVNTTGSGERPVWQLACLAAVYTMLERGRGNEGAMIDDWFADPREHGGASPGAIRPGYVGGDVPFDVSKLAGELDAGRPVILRAVGGPLGQHFVLAVAVEGDGEGRTVRALDPWPGQNAADDAPGHVLQLPLVATPEHPLIPGLVFTHMRQVAD